MNEREKELAEIAKSGLDQLPDGYNAVIAFASVDSEQNLTLPVVWTCFGTSSKGCARRVLTSQLEQVIAAMRDVTEHESPLAFVPISTDADVPTECPPGMLPSLIRAVSGVARSVKPGTGHFFIAFRDPFWLKENEASPVYLASTFSTLSLRAMLEILLASDLFKPNT